MLHKKITYGFIAVTLALSTSLLGYASSHREAPLISGDPKVDATDLYAFVSPEKNNTVTLIANYIPLEEPAGGPNFYSFDPRALYEINVDNNGDAKPDITYQFRFKTTVMNPNTFLYNTGPINSLTDPDWNVKQTYTLTKIENGTSTIIGTDLPMPPANVGPKSTPDYASLQAQAINTLSNGTKVFAGPSDDPFFVDLGATFDLLTIRNLPGDSKGGVNTVQGYNVHSIALQVPISQLTKNKNIPSSATSTDAVIGVWTTASRKSMSVLGATGSITDSGDWIQVSRLGAPLVNEVVIPIGSKDLFNSSKPENDAQFAEFVANPEVPKLLKALYNINVPPQGSFGSSTQRDDLIAIFLTGIPGLTQPANVKPSEQLRLNVAIASTNNPSRLGVLGGDTQGFPNGRRLSDDVVDIALRAIAGAAYPLFHPEFTPDATGIRLGDGVDNNDKVFRGSFPYMALPTSGFDSIPHGVANNTGNGTTTNPGTGTGTSTSPGTGTGTGTSTNPGTGNGTTTNPGMGNGTSPSAIVRALDKCIFSKNLSLGIRSQDVRCIQEFLITNRFLNINRPTGHFGELTRDAISRWQASLENDQEIGIFTNPGTGAGTTTNTSNGSSTSGTSTSINTGSGTTTGSSINSGNGTSSSSSSTTGTSNSSTGNGSTTGSRTQSN